MVRQDLKYLVAALLVLAPGAPAADIQQELRDLNRRFGGRLGLMAKNLTTGEEIAFHAGERVPTASTIKLPILAALFDQVRSGKLSLDDRITYEASDRKPGSGILRALQPGLRLTLRDAATLMITLSDNAATNLVIDRLGATQTDRLAVVNAFVRECGLTETRLLNRVYSVETKQSTPEAIRFGLGVTTPREMVLLLDRLYRRTLVDSASSEEMLRILEEQFYNDKIPRFLPETAVRTLTVAHKTGGLNELRADVGLVLSDKADFAIAVYVEKHPDHGIAIDNQAELLCAYATRAVWNYYTGMTGYERGPVLTSQVDWNSTPGGMWGIYRSTHAMFPHPVRANGFIRSDGTCYPYFPHYADSSIIVCIPKGFVPTAEGTNVIVHFHGHMNDNLGVLEHYGMPGAINETKTNAILVLPQGPVFARDSFGGKMEDSSGFRLMVEDVMAMLVKESVVPSTAVARIIVSAHSGGYRPAGTVLDRGGLQEKISNVFLFDALYGEHDAFVTWLLNGRGRIQAAYTAHLAGEHADVAARVKDAGARWSMTATDVEHDAVVQEFFGRWLAQLGPEWKLPVR
jgi:beta-lactamase class A